MKALFLVSLVTGYLALGSQAALADMYKCVDGGGHVTYSNAPAKGCRKLVIEPAVSAPAPYKPPVSRETSSFPKVDSSVQQARDDMRRRLLDGELESEEESLTRARAKLAEQESTIAEGERNVTQRCTPAADGGMNCTAVPGGINGARVEARLKPYRDQVAQHERNIEALNRELSNLR